MVPEIKSFVKKNLPMLVSIIKATKDSAKHQSSRGRVKRLLNNKNKLYVEVGAGDKKGENGWTTVDITDNCDIYWDLRNGLPFPDKSVHKIYSSHFLEHLSYSEGQEFLAECLRVLVSGGSFSICVPNARIYLEAYLKSTSLDKDLFLSHKVAYNNTTSMDYVNYMAYMNGEHKYMFDQENLVYRLQSKGFKNARQRAFDPSRDLKSRDCLSIYAEAESP